MKFHLPYIHTFQIDDYGDSMFNAVFAIKLDRFPLQNGVEDGRRSAEKKHLAEMIDFINTQYCLHPERTLALRYIITPNLTHYLKGRVEVVLFAQTSSMTENEAINEAVSYARGLSAILGGNFPEHLWNFIENERAFDKVWNPFENKELNIAEIRRREDFILTNTMNLRPTLGRQRNLISEKPKNDEDHVYYVHSFIPRPNNLNRLIRILLLHQAPIIWQTTIKSINIQSDEEIALANEISKCEKIYYSGATVREQGKNLGPTLPHLRAGDLAQNLIQHLLRLKDAPFLLSIALASPEKIPQEIVEAVGVEITAPVGNLLVEPLTVSRSFLQMGGYDTVFPSNTSELQIAKKNFQYLRFDLWGERLAPASLKRLRFMVDANEAACSFRLPIMGEEMLPGIDVNRVKNSLLLLKETTQKKLPRKGRLFVGYNRYKKQKQAVYIGEKDRKQHMYIVGQTGTGKTTLLKTMILEDIKTGNGVAVIDPHGDLFDELLGLIPDERIEDVVILDPTDISHPVGLNFLEYQDPYERYFVVREFKAILERLLKDQYGRNYNDFAGPVFWKHVQMNLLLVMSQLNDPGTLLQFERIFNSSDYWRKFIPPQIRDNYLDIWVKEDLPKLDYIERRSPNELSMGEYISGKFSDFLFDPKIRMIFGQKRSTIDFRKIMDSGQILLVNLAKGELTEANARFLGMLLMAKLQATAMKRANVPPEKRRIFYLYVDEFQSLATENFVLLLSEARKFGLALILANQFLSQIEDERIVQSVFGNVGTVISFRVSQEDAHKYLGPHFAPTFSPFDLINLPNWQACVKTTLNGQVILPFSLQTILPKQPYQNDVAREVRSQSRRKYGRERAKVEKEIEQSLFYQPQKKLKMEE
ncbi:type IV secretory system conjugative DNA transfer family protein [Caldithrix abyssi]